MLLLQMPDWPLVILIGLICFSLGAFVEKIFALHEMKDIAKEYKLDLLEKHSEWWAKKLIEEANEFDLDTIYSFVEQFKIFDKGEIQNSEEDSQESE